MVELYQLDMPAVPAEADHAYILARLRAFNDMHSPAHKTSRDPAYGDQPLHIYIRDAHGTIWGGIIAHTIWNWLEIDLFWLDETVRRSGYGTRLIQATEAEAVRRGCVHSKVGTFSFQARGFYEKMGYHVVGQIDDYPPGGIDYTLVKDLRAVHP